MRQYQKADWDKIINLSMLYVCKKTTPVDDFWIKIWRSISDEHERIFQFLISPEVCKGLLDEVNKKKKPDL